MSRSFEWPSAEPAVKKPATPRALGQHDLPRAGSQKALQRSLTRGPDYASCHCSCIPGQGATDRRRHGQPAGSPQAQPTRSRGWLVGLIIYRHGLRVSEACDLRWDDIDLPKRTIIVRRLKGSTDSVHYLERDEVNGLKLLRRQQQANGIKGAYVFINEGGQPFGASMSIGRMIERAGEAAGLPFPVHVHMLRHSTGYAPAARGMDTRRLQHFLGHGTLYGDVPGAFQRHLALISFKRGAMQVCGDHPGLPGDALNPFSGYFG